MKNVYIDYSNLKYGTKIDSWELNLKSFRSWCRDKFKADNVFIFIGKIEENNDFYNILLKFNYKIIFKPTVKSKEGVIKGNIDGELILKICRDYFENNLEECFLVSNDGDFNCIIEFLKEKQKIVKIITPTNKCTSWLLRKTNIPIIRLFDFKEKLKIK